MKYFRNGLLLAVLFFTSSCEDRVVDLGSGFGLGRAPQSLSGMGTHSPGPPVTLVRRAPGNSWRTIWPELSFRSGGPFVLDGAILFGAVTSVEQIEQQSVRLLFFDDALGAVDITQEIARRGGYSGEIHVSRIDGKRSGESFMIRFGYAPEVSASVPIQDLHEIAAAIVRRNVQHSFRGFTVHE